MIIFLVDVYMCLPLQSNSSELFHNHFHHHITCCEEHNDDCSRLETSFDNFCFLTWKSENTYLEGEKYFYKKKIIGKISFTITRLWTQRTGAVWHSSSGLEYV